MKSIFIFTPSFHVHGGIRVILEWANRLSEKHRVYLHSLKKDHCNWFPLSPAVNVVADTMNLEGCDLMIITSPHSIHYANVERPVRKVIFLQMMEHYFRPGDAQWVDLCNRTYLSPLPLISISQWNIEEMCKRGRTGPTFYVGNGVNLDHFPISDTPKQMHPPSVLVEGWSPGNVTKDSERLGARVAARLKARKKVRVLAYSALPLKGPFEDVPDVFIRNPSLVELNRLYEEATILIKATKMDARSCSPMEAMTKGTVTVRAIMKGDDDLFDGENCLRCPYEEHTLYQQSLLLLEKYEKWKRLSDNCRLYVRTHNWDFWMERIERILWTEIN